MATEISIGGVTMTDRNDAVYIISVAAEIVGMHPQTLRVYERKGLVERILRLQAENTRLRAQVDRLRRLLEDAERRRGSTPGTMLIEMGRTTKRQLPAIRRRATGDS